MSHGWITRLVAGPLERNDAIVRPTSAGSGARPSDATRSERHRRMRTTLTPRIVLSDSKRCGMKSCVKRNLQSESGTSTGVPKGGR